MFTMKPRALLALVCLLLGSTSIATAGTWRAETTIGGKLQTHVYVPDSVSPLNDQRALMVSLHGCTQTNDEMKQGASWADEAEQYGMVVALPQASNEGSYGYMGCWNFHVGMNMSRTSSDAKYLLDLVDALLGDGSLNIDPNQVYITGLSSGAGMASSIGCLAPEVFAGVGVNAGPAPGSDGNAMGLSNPDISVSQGKANCENLSNKNSANAQAHLYTQVHNSVCGSSDSTVSPAWCDRNADVMRAVYGADTTISSCDGGANPTSIDGGGAVNTWCDASGDRVSKIIINGMSHAWPAGPDSSGGGSYIDHSHTDYPAYIAAFFTDNNRRVSGTGGGGGGGTGGTTGACEAFTATNSEHETAGRAYSETTGYWWNQTTTWYAQGSGENLGTVGGNQTTLYLGNDGSYYLNDPADCPVDDGGTGGGGDGGTGGGGTGGGTAQLDSYTLAPKTYANHYAREYKVYVPANVQHPAPMVMALHGCKIDHNEVLNDYGLMQKADEEGFILVAPFITDWPATEMRDPNCWGFWYDTQQHQGSGEPEDLHQIALEVEANYDIDPNRRYLTGLSSGGAMASIVSMTHNEYWSAIAAASGVPYDETANSVDIQRDCNSDYTTLKSVSSLVGSAQAELDSDYAVPLMVLHNQADCIVPQGNADNMRDTHLQLWGGNLAQTVACESYIDSNFNCQHRYYTVDGAVGSRSVVETIFYNGPQTTPNTEDSDTAHYWIGGVNGRWARVDGPNYPDLIWDFFDRNPRDGSGPSNAPPSISLNGPSTVVLSVGDVFVDEGATASDAEDGTLAVVTDCNVDTATAGTYSCTYTATDSAGQTASVTRTVVVEDGSGGGSSDTTAPVITLNGSASMTLTVGDSFTDPGASASDDVDGDISSQIVVTGNVDTATAGSYTLSYDVSDAAGNAAATVTRTVVVEAGYACQEYTDDNWAHYSAGRATNCMGYACAVGSGTNLGLLNTYTVTTLAETAPGYYERASCP